MSKITERRIDGLKFHAKHLQEDWKRQRQGNISAYSVSFKDFGKIPENVFVKVDKDGWIEDDFSADVALATRKAGFETVPVKVA